MISEWKEIHKIDRHDQPLPLSLSLSLSLSIYIYIYIYVVCSIGVPEIKVLFQEFCILWCFRFSLVLWSAGRLRECAGGRTDGRGRASDWLPLWICMHASVIMDRPVLVRQSRPSCMLLMEWCQFETLKSKRGTWEGRKWAPLAAVLYVYRHTKVWSNTNNNCRVDFMENPYLQQSSKSLYSETPLNSRRLNIHASVGIQWGRIRFRGKVGASKKWEKMGRYGQRTENSVQKVKKNLGGRKTYLTNIIDTLA